MGPPGTGLKCEFKVENLGFFFFVIIPRQPLGVRPSHRAPAPILPKSPKTGPKKKKPREPTCGGQGEVEEEGPALVEQEGHQVLQESTKRSEGAQTSPGTQNGAPGANP